MNVDHITPGSPGCSRDSVPAPLAMELVDAVLNLDRFSLCVFLHPKMPNTSGGVG